MSRSIHKRKFGLNQALRSSLVMLPIAITIIVLIFAVWRYGLVSYNFYGYATFMLSVDWVLVVVEFFVEIAYYTQRYKAYLKLNGSMFVLATVFGIVWSIMKPVSWYYYFILSMVIIDLFIFLRIMVTKHKYQ